MAVLIIAADIGAKAFYLLMIWLASAIGASELSKRKGYGEKWGQREARKAAAVEAADIAEERKG